MAALDATTDPSAMAVRKETRASSAPTAPKRNARSERGNHIGRDAPPRHDVRSGRDARPERDGRPEGSARFQGADRDGLPARPDRPEGNARSERARRLNVTRRPFAVIASDPMRGRGVMTTLNATRDPERAGSPEADEQLEHSSRAEGDPSPPGNRGSEPDADSSVAPARANARLGRADSPEGSARSARDDHSEREASAESDDRPPRDAGFEHDISSEGDARPERDGGSDRKARSERSEQPERDTRSERGAHFEGNARPERTQQSRKGWAKASPRPAKQRARHPKGGGMASRDEGDGERLQKVLSRAGLASRREAEDWIRAGRITVNGKPAVLGLRVTPSDQLRLDGRLIRQRDTSKGATAFIVHRSPGESLTSPHADALSEAGEAPGTAVIERLPSRAGRRFITISPMPRVDGGLELVTSDGELGVQLQRSVRHLSVSSASAF